ncbi:alkaline phosphatase [Brumimicrobium aurantiacum]|uniref:Alkaline phosphatase n=1 Tax=Brumimicrobium aurantiacum TaxID=1737063 RepID=A0A3E1F1D7_9FLAO|nr:alkaline phosphatase [Brumimicrobium aurantiacum]RFC55641.1 alkaline phosphatase [Brumimicrobium aurantiacum]
MKRRDFFRNSSLTAAGLALSPMLFSADDNTSLLLADLKDEAKNIIFLVSDGMSIGTLTMADLHLQTTVGKHSTWIENYKNGRFKRASMDTASASSLVTDSAAGGSAWGGGVRVPNGALNVGANGEFHKPILQKFKAVGKKVGCVTTVPITHATPASFCVNNKSRNNQPEIAEQYLELKFDVMMGGGDQYFSAEKRDDKKDVYAGFKTAGYDIAKTKSGMNNSLNTNKPLLGVFSDDSMPYTIDHKSDKKLQNEVPTLAEMTGVAINKMKGSSDGFVLQVEGGKVDWAAHANDAPGLIYDQIAFDEALKVALDFAIEDGNTLIIVTTDHGNANPGLFKGSKADENFARYQTMKKSNTWVMQNLHANLKPSQLTELIEFGQGFAISDDEVKIILNHVEGLSEEELQDYNKMPYEKFAQIHKNYTNVGFGDMNHSADFVECAAFGPGSELLTPFIKNTFLHNMMLRSVGITK